MASGASCVYGGFSMRRERFPSRIGSILGRVFKNLDIDKKMKQLEALNQWREVVGDKINLHTRPLSIRKKSLFVLVDSSSWLAQLTYLRHKIISEFHRRYGKGVIENIYFRLGEVRKVGSGKRGASVKERKGSPRLPKREMQRIEDTLSTVNDTSLSRVLRRILIKQKEVSQGREEMSHESPE